MNYANICQLPGRAYLQWCARASVSVSVRVCVRVSVLVPGCVELSDLVIAASTMMS